MMDRKMLVTFQSTAHPKAGRNVKPASAPRAVKQRFQSTAHPKAGRNARGYLGHAPRCVSIHGPPEGRPKQHRSPLVLLTGAVSIHGPPEGRPKRATWLFLAPEQDCFNPRPTRRQAETRLQRNGRPACAPFQSTAHPKAGRNISFCRASSSYLLFQSTAHPKAGRN